MIGLRHCVYSVSATGPSSPFRGYLRVRPEALPTFEELETVLAAGSPAAMKAAGRLISGQCESGLRYARETAAEESIFVDAC